MTWLEMANMLFEKSRALSPRGAHVHLDTADWLRTWTRHQSQAADAVARAFAQGLDWPAMASESECQLYFRCLFAIERCIDFHAHSSQPPDSHESERHAIEALLIESWHLEGIEWAERRYRPKVSRTLRACA